MKKLIVFLMLLATVTASAQYLNKAPSKSYAYWATKWLQVDNDLYWKGDTIKKNLLIYADLKTDSIRFQRIAGTWSPWYYPGTGGGGSYVLPTASGTVKGGVKVGSGLSIDGSAVLNLNFTETDPTIYAWAKASTKPSYTYSEIGAAASGHDHSGVYEPIISKALGYAKWNGSAWTFVNETYLTSFTETDPTIYSWAKASTKPTYTYTEVGAAASGHNHSGVYEPVISKALGYAKWNGSTWTFVNETYLTSFTETDPTIYSWAKAATKPSYTYTEVGAAASGHNHNSAYAAKANEGLVFVGAGTTGYAMNGFYFDGGLGGITPRLDLTPTDGSTLPTTSNAVYWGLAGKEPAISKSTGYAKWNGSAWTFVNETYLTNFTETDPTIYSWAKASTKPTYTYTEVGAAAVNGSTAQNFGAYLVDFGGNWRATPSGSDFQIQISGLGYYNFGSTGNFEATGTVKGSEVYRGSSRRLKTNIRKLDDCALDIIRDTKIYTYNLKKSGDFGVGFIAEGTHVWLSGPDFKGHLMGNHLGLLTKAMQEQQTQIEDLQKKLQELEKQVNNLNKRRVR